MSEAETPPPPGTPKAAARGCAYCPWDGEARRIETYPQWLVDGCPVHDPEAVNGTR